uniref:Uncharacterized protein n=1 Tax=Cucumis melo TaxID=3656 RepID=A0A9I9ECF1_CUCME
MLPKGTRSVLVQPVVQNLKQSGNEMEKMGGFILLASSLSYAFSDKDRAWIRALANKYNSEINFFLVHNNVGVGGDLNLHFQGKLIMHRLTYKSYFLVQLFARDGKEQKRNVVNIIRTFKREIFSISMPFLFSSLPLGQNLRDALYVLGIKFWISSTYLVHIAVFTWITKMNMASRSWHENFDMLQHQNLLRTLGFA